MLIPFCTGNIMCIYKAVFSRRFSENWVGRFKNNPFVNTWCYSSVYKEPFKSVVQISLSYILTLLENQHIE